jgi:MOSC domain-containing protein YiiM
VNPKGSNPHIIALARDGDHRFSKCSAPQLRLIAGHGVEGDAHCSTTVKHRSRVAADPGQPNLRQVHLIHAELFTELAARGFTVSPGELGENITTQGLDLLSLPRGTVLRIGAEVQLEVTGLRNPCGQIERFQPGLLAAVLDKGPGGEVIRKAGIMAVVRVGGMVRCGDTIGLELPAMPHLPLERV